MYLSLHNRDALYPWFCLLALKALLQKRSAYHSSWRRKWQPTAVFLPGESHRQRSLAGYITVYGVTRVRHDRATKYTHHSPDTPCFSLEKYRTLVLFGLMPELMLTPVWSCLSSHMCPGLRPQHGRAPFTAFHLLISARAASWAPWELSHANSQVREGPSFPGFLFLWE